MNQDQNTSPAPNGLRGEVQALRRQIAEHERQLVSRRVKILTAGLVVAAASVVSFAFLTARVLELDARTVAKTGRIHLQRHIPAGRATIQSYLTAEAPNIVGATFRTMADQMPDLRNALARSVESLLDGALAEGESEYRRSIRNEVAKAWADVERDFPGLDDSARLDKLLDRVSAHFNEGVTRVYAELQPDCSREMARLRGEIDRLGATPAAELTLRERTEKEMMQTLLQICAQERAARPSAR